MEEVRGEGRGDEVEEEPLDAKLNPKLNVSGSRFAALVGVLA